MNAFLLFSRVTWSSPTIKLHLVSSVCSSLVFCSRVHESRRVKALVTVYAVFCLFCHSYGLMLHCRLPTAVASCVLLGSGEKHGVMHKDCLRRFRRGRNQ